MARRIFEIDDAVPDEAEDVRAILKKHGVPFYETPGGQYYGYGSRAALWVASDDDYDKARALVDDYERVRLRKSMIETKGDTPIGTITTIAVIAILGAIFWLVSITHTH